VDGGRAVLRVHRVRRVLRVLRVVRARKARRHRRRAKRHRRLQLGELKRPFNSRVVGKVVVVDKGARVENDVASAAVGAGAGSIRLA
jgi:hypothetical protein